MKRLFKTGFYFCSAVLLLAVALLAGELCVRWQLRQDKEHLRTETSARLTGVYQEDQAIIDATASASAGGATNASDLRTPAWESALQDCPEEQRGALAGELAAWLLYCDQEGRIVASYPPVPGRVKETIVPSDIHALALAHPPGGSVYEVLDQQDQASVRGSLAKAFSADREPPQYFDVSFPDGGRNNLEWQTGAPSASAIPGMLPLCITHRYWARVAFRFRNSMDVEDLLEYWPGTRLKTNALGWRDDEVTIPKPAGVYRIVCAGGSTTVGGPRTDLTYPNLLEKSLRKTFGTDRIEVVNCGMYAASSWVITQRLDDYFALEPDLIIQYDFVNDMLPTHHNWIYESPWGWALRPLARSDLAHYYFNGLFRLPAGQLRQRYREGILANFQKTVDAARGTGTRVGFASFAYPTPDSMEPWESRFFLLNRAAVWSCEWDTAGYAEAAEVFNDELKHYCAEQDAFYLPVAEHVQGGTGTFIDICHLHVGAMQTMADTIAGSIHDLVAEGLKANAP